MKKKILQPSRSGIKQQRPVDVATNGIGTNGALHLLVATIQIST